MFHPPLFPFVSCSQFYSQCPLCLPTSSRPLEVGVWLRNRLYTNDQIPRVTNAGTYAMTWILWWKACQQSWQKSKEWPLLREVPDCTKWEKLTACSQNGTFLVVMSTTWWAFALKSPDDQRVFDKAVDAIQDPTPDPPQVADPPRATWLVCKEGKHQPKPSCMLLESMSWEQKLIHTYPAFYITCHSLEYNNSFLHSN